MKTSNSSASAEPVGVPKSKADDQMMKDAYLYGADHPDMQELLQKPFTMMAGKLYGQKDRRNTQDGDWVESEMPLLAWMLGQDKGKNSWGLARHPVAKRKAGSCFVPGIGYDGGRGEKAMHTMTAIVLDIDGGSTLDAAIDALEDAGLFALVYTSFRHMATQLELNHDDIVRKVSGPVTTPKVREYLKEHYKDRYPAHIVDAAELIEARHKGHTTLVKVPPIEKFRVVLPLWEAVKLTDLGETMPKYKAKWAGAVCSVSNMLGLDHDSASERINQVYYNPRHPADAPDWHSAIIQGRPLRFEDIECAVDSDPFAAGTTDTGLREHFETSDGFDLNNWHRKYKDRWLACDVVEAFCDDKIADAGSKVGTTSITCPFSHEHSSGDGGCYVMNPDENVYGYWSISCRHDACQGRDKLDFVREMLDQGWFPGSVLYDDDWCLPVADQDIQPDQTSTDDYTAPEPLSAPLFDQSLAVAGKVKNKHVEKVTDQMAASLRGRFAHVIDSGGKNKVYIIPQRGRLPEVWDAPALDNYYKNQAPFYVEKGGSGKKDKVVPIKPANAFWFDPVRTTYQGTEFEPDLSKADETKFNTFNGFPIPPRQGSWSNLRNHLRDNLCAGNGSDENSDDDLFNYFMTWCADIFQNPGNKKGSSIAVMGEQGTGKSKFFDWLRKAVGDYGIKVASKKHLVGSFNSHLDSKLLVVAEEAFWSGDKEAASVLKDLITSDTYTVERKGVDAVERKNYMRKGFVTNNDWAVPTDDNADARRFLVLRAGNDQKQNGAYFAAIDKQMNNGGLEAMVFEFMTWDPTKHGLTWDSLRQAPWTPARAEQATQGASFAMTALLQAIDDGLFTDRDGVDVPLSDTKTTRVNRTDLAAYMKGSKTHGGAAAAVKKAIAQVLGDDAWDTTPHKFEDGTTARYIDIPPLNDLRGQIKDTFQ